MFIVFLAFCGTQASSSAMADGGMVLDPSVWKLVVDHDFRNGDLPFLYGEYCGHQGSGGTERNNFSTANVYFKNGALEIKLEKRTNTSCTNVTRPYAGGGFGVQIAPGVPLLARDIAVEMEIVHPAANVPGASPYAALWASRLSDAPHSGCPKPGIAYWAAEDDFFESFGRGAINHSTYHTWTTNGTCTKITRPLLTTVPTMATAYHAYGSARRGGTASFFIDGRNVKSETAYFKNFNMNPAVGYGAKNPTATTDAHLPAVLRIRSIKVWIATSASQTSPYSKGMLRFNKTTRKPEYYTGSVWVPISEPVGKSRESGVSNPPPQPASSIRIEAGGTDNLTADGNTWLSDRYFLGGETVNRRAIAIENTVNDRLYQTERWGMSGYNIPVANGTYTVHLSFAETNPWITGAGQRLFHINIEGNRRLTDFDVYTEAGGRNRAITKTYTGVRVTDGRMNIDFIKTSKNSPMVNAIQVLPQ